MEQSKEFLKLVDGMLIAAAKFPITEPYGYSSNEEEVKSNYTNANSGQKEAVDWMLENGLLKAFQCKGKGILSLLLTLDVFEEPYKYHLSVTFIPERMKFGPIPKELIPVLLQAFFKGKGKEISNPSGIKDARHFVCDKSDLEK